MTQAPVELRGVLSGSTLNLAGGVCAALSQFALVVVVTQAFSRQVAGWFFTATSLFLLVVGLAQLGTSTGVVYFLSRCRARDAFDLVPRYLRSASVPVTVFSVVLGIALTVLAPQVAAMSTSGDPGELVTYLRILGALVPAACLAQVALAATRATQTMRANAFVDQMGRPLLQLVLVGVLAWAGAPALLAGAWGLPVLAAALTAWLWWARIQHTGGAATYPAPSEVEVGRQFWRFTWPRAVAHVGQVGLQRLDIVLVAGLRGPADAAVYAAVTRFLVLGQLGSQAVSVAAQPRLGAALAGDDRALARRLYGTSTAWLILASWPLYLTLAWFAPVLLGVFGDGYSEGAGSLLLLSLGMLVATGCGMVDMVLTMAGRTTWNLANTLLALAVLVGVDLWLIPTLGILGAAVGWCAARAVANLVALTQVALALGLHPFGRPFATALTLAVAFFGVLPGMARLLWGPTWTGLVLGAGLAGVCYLAAATRYRSALELDVIATGREGARDWH
jgi:O-antigen/teichoic acid export membrane protein